MYTISGMKDFVHGSFGGILLIFMMFGATFASGANSIELPELTYLDRSWTNCKLSKENAAQVKVVHSSGVARIPIESLPEELQEKFNFDSAASESYRKSHPSAQRQFQQWEQHDSLPNRIFELKEFVYDKRTYKDCKISKANDAQAKVVHGSGLRYVPIEALPNYMQRRFRFDLAKATAYRKKSAKAQKALDQWLAEQGKSDQPEEKQSRKTSSNSKEDEKSDQKREIRVRGRVKARLIGMRDGNKTIQVIARAGTENMKVVVRDVYPRHQSRTFRVNKGEKVIRVFTVHNEYSCTAYEGSKVVDKESARRKTGLK